MYSDFEKKVLEYCNKHKMFPKGKILVAFSGGGDSVALLYVLKNIMDDLGITIEAAHLNHSLRGEESDKDEKFCIDFCSNMNIPLTVEYLEVGEINQNEGSVETAAREARMAFLKRLAFEKNFIRIATGHTLDDQVETILHRIIRGTGPSGLSGILPVRENLWARPILWAFREEVRDYITEKGIAYREDSTNIDTTFFRNRIRHELIPLLKKRFSPGITGAISRLAELTRIQEEYLEGKMTGAYKDCVIHEDRYKILLDKLRLISYHKVLKQRIVRHCLKVLEGAGRDADMEEIENILELFNHKRGSADITSKIKCGVEGRYIIFLIRSKTEKSVPLKLSGKTLIPFDGGCIISKKISQEFKVDGKMNIVINHEIIEQYGDLTVGTVKPGERIKPFGMNKTVKIRDIFSDVSLPKVLRDYMPVIRAGAVPIWIPGIRSSEYLRTNTPNARTDNLVYLQFKDGIQWS